MLMFFKQGCLSAVVAVSVAALCVGCAKLDTGAHAEPSVRIKPAATAIVKADGDTSKTTVEPLVPTGAPGTLVGRVVFEGPRPTPSVIFKQGKATKDETVCSVTGDIPREELVVSEKNGVANVFIYLDKPPAGFKATPPETEIVFDQKNCRFLTHALFVQVGQSIRLVNDDALLHNTHCVAPRNGDKNFPVGANDRKGVALVYKKAEREPLYVKCDLHSWMNAYHLVLEHPFAAVSDADGQFKIENLPAGNHQFKVWHELGDGGKSGLLESKYKVTIKSGEETSVTITAGAKKFGL